MMNFIKKYWFLVFLLIVLIIILFLGQKNIAEMQKKIDDKNAKIEVLESQLAKNLKIIDSLETLDPVIVKEIDTIRIKADENIKYVDTMSVSDMQDFFAKRYN